jgi:DNA-binding LytR/AlgR family response regulator
VEDEPLLALELAEILKEVGCEAVGPAGTPEGALRLIDAVRLDGAFLDANLRGHPVGEVAAALTRHGVPFAFVTGYGRESLPAAFQAVTMLNKPCRPEELVEQAAKLVARRQRQGTTIPFRNRSE